MVTVTTSWDDGDARDVRVVALLDTYGARGSFYVTKAYRSHRLSEDAIRELAARHEIGAHTLTHPDLTVLSYEEQLKELRGSKEWLESVLGREIDMACYPFGRANDSARKAAKDAGFIGARSTRKTLGEAAVNPFDMPVTMMTYRLPYGFLHKASLALRRGTGVSIEHAPFLRNDAWLQRAKDKFSTVRAQGGVFHVWGHSWEVDELDLWRSLEELLAYIAGCEDVQFKTNGEVIRSLSASAQAT